MPIAVRDRRFAALIVLLLIVACSSAWAQTAPNHHGTLQGRVSDPSGAVVPGAAIAVTSSTGKTVNTFSDNRGKYSLSGLPAGSYQVTGTMQGFAVFRAAKVDVAAGKSRSLDVSLTIEVVQQVRVDAESEGIGTDPDSNANAIVLQGADLNALSDDPEELEAELQALAGPSAGPNGGQIYIDGFTGGSLPPKSSIREIRVNQNPFSAQYDRLGYGRIEIYTRAGSDHLHGEFGARGNDSAFNSRNPIITGPPPAYFSYDLRGAVGGSIAKNVSYFVSLFSRNHQSTGVVNATDPASITAGNPAGTLLNEAFRSPMDGLDLSGRIDVQAGESNTLRFRYDLSRSGSKNQGPGETSLFTQAYDTRALENDIQISDSIVRGRLVNDARFHYRRILSRQLAQNVSPTVTVQGAFTGGGSEAGSSHANQDNFEWQDFVALASGRHSLNVGGRARLYRDADTTESGSNGSYVFASTNAYLNRSPQTYSVNVVKNPTAHITLFDTALFFQDDWKQSPRFTLSYGLRWEAQNRIHDHSDWAPRVSFAYALGDPAAGRPAKTILRAGYGWFFQRFTVPGNLASLSGAPYLATAVHQNGVNQVAYTVTDPAGYQETAPGVAVKPANPSKSESALTRYSVAKNIHAASDLQAAVGIDRQLSRRMTANITYLYSRGVHQYLTNNLGASTFSTLSTGTYPNAPVAPASANLMQFQSGGVYREHQLTATVSARFRLVSTTGFYAYSNARGDTNGVTYVPSIAQDPGFDYGRSSFDLHHRLVVLGNVFVPFGVAVSPEFVYNSGTPYNITAGSDLTGNNQFNARPTFAERARCTGASIMYVSTPYGCLDSDPIGTQEKIVPYGLGTGPSNLALNLHVSKVFGIGPRTGNSGGPASGGPPPPPGGGPGGLGAGGLSDGPNGPAPPADATSSRRCSLRLSAVAHNLFNSQNLGNPNGVLTAPSSLRFQSQSLAGGPFNPPEGGNRSIFLEMQWSF